MMKDMARQELDTTPQAEERRLELLWDAYKAQEDELIALQKDLDAALEGRDQLQAKLDKEEERLQKLWDAYRAQEDELADLKERLPLMEEKLVERERTIQSLQRDISLLEPLTKKSQAITDLSRENEQLKADMEVLRSQVLSNKGDPNKELQKAQADLAAEKQRLEKLYVLYQDQEAEVESLTKTIKEWEAWAKKVRPALGS